MLAKRVHAASKELKGESCSGAVFGATRAYARSVGAEAWEQLEHCWFGSKVAHELLEQLLCCCCGSKAVLRFKSRCVAVRKLLCCSSKVAVLRFESRS